MDQLTRQIAKESGESFASRGELAELRRLQAAWENAQRAILAHTDSGAKAAWLAHQKELEGAIARGDLDKMDGYSREEFETEFRAKMEAAKMAVRTVTREASPLIEPVAERFAKVAEKFGADAAQAEADAYKRFGVQYPGPSSLVAALRQAAAYARARVPRGQHANTSPKDCLPYITF